MAGRWNRSPFTSTASISMTFTPGSALSGKPIPFDSYRLTNTTRVPVKVQEIRILARATMDVGTPASNPMVAPFVFLEGKLGKHYLTDGRVPMAVVAPYRYRQDNNIGGGNDLDDLYAATTTNNVVVVTRRIVLTRPLYLRPGVGFNFTGSIPGDPLLLGLITTAFTVNLFVTLVGQFMGPGESIPETHDVPIISAVQLGQSNRISLEGDLRNPLSVPITVHRFVGSRPTTSDPTILARSRTEGTTIDFRFPDDSPYSEDALDFVHVFGQLRVWPVKFTMDGNKRITARISRNAAEDDGSTRVAYQVGLFGTRPEIVQ